MNRISMSAAALGIALLLTTAEAQQPFYYPEPPASAFRVTKNVPYTTALGAAAIDIYRPTTPGVAPALILFTARWASDTRSPREADSRALAWAKLAAAAGIVAVIPEMRAEEGTGNATNPTRIMNGELSRVVEHLVSHAAEYGIDRDRLAVMGASGGVWAALPAVQDPRQTAIKAAVMYYGGGKVDAFRLDLPVLFVRAGLDSRAINNDIDRLIAQALAENAPVSLLNNNTAYHGFEARNDDAATRQTIEQTIAFIKHATTPEFQQTLRDRKLDALAAAQIAAANYAGAAQTYSQLAALRPSDGSVRFAYGRMLLADKQYAPACRELRALTPISFEAILPTTRSCVLAGASDSAMAWLQGVRKDWMRSDYLNTLKTDSVFAPLWTRPAFQSLFRP
jgi:dienelactone hydrolase